MKYRFLLDENVLQHAIKGVDKHDNPDLTCASLVLSIARNCHSITLNRWLIGRYLRRLQNLAKDRSRVLEPVFFIKEFIKNSAKAVTEYEGPPGLPSGAKIPDEDVEIVRAALVSRPLFVTCDEELREAIQNCAALHLRAITPAEAITLAQES